MIKGESLLGYLLVHLSYLFDKNLKKYGDRSMSKQHFSNISTHMIIALLLKVKHLRWRPFAISRSLLTDLVKFLGKYNEFLVNMFERRNVNEKQIRFIH